MAGCPACGSDRLKRAPIFLLGRVIEPVVSRRRRYRCVDCGWTGWKGRLHRRSAGLRSLHPATTVQKREAWFFLFVVSFMLVTTVLAVRSCAPSLPDPSDVDRTTRLP